MLRVQRLLLVAVAATTATLTFGVGLSIPTLSIPTVSASASTYTIVSGDSLIGISSKLKVTLTALLEANRLTRTSVIHPGRVLQVPSSAPAMVVATPAPVVASPTAPTAPTAAAPLVYVVQRNDFLLGIAAMLGVSLDSLLTTNKLVRTSVILPGQKLIVPPGGRLPNIIAAPSAPTPIPAAGLDARIVKVLDYARAQLGKPYRFGMAGPDSFDCSGLTKMAYATISVSLPHYSVAQSERGNAVNWTTQAIRPGDLVFLVDVGTTTIGHVGIAISATQWIHSPRTGDVVRIGTIPMDRVVSVRRLVGA